MEGGRHTWLGNFLGCARAPPPHIYIGGRERGGNQGAPQVGSKSYLGFPQVAPPFLILSKKKGKGEERKEGGLNPLCSFSNLASCLRGGAQPLVGRCAPLIWPIWPISSPGGSGNPPGTPINV